MKKLSLLRASAEVTKAYQTVAESKGQYRFGQALWNNLEETEFSGLLEWKQSEGIDFYYFPNPSKVLELFYAEFVQPVPEGADPHMVAVDLSSKRDYTGYQEVVVNPMGLDFQCSASLVRGILHG